MRVFKPAYTVPRPAGCRVLDRADGRYVRYRDKRGREVVARLSKSGKRIVLETRDWSLQFRDHQDIERTLPVDPDRGATDRIAATVEDLLSARAGGGGIDKDLRKRIEGLPVRIRAALGEWGLLDERATVVAKPLAELVTLYESSLKAREKSEQYIESTIADIKVVCDACGFAFYSQIDAAKVESYLKGRRSDGISYRRSNGLLTAVKMLCKWAVKQGYINENPVACLSLLNVEKDPRRVRRVLEVEDLQRLLAVTLQAPTRHGLTGYERYLVYRLAVETGLRRGEIMSLRAGDFHWATLTVELGAKFTKNGQATRQPLRPDLAAELRAYLSDKLPTAKAFRLPHDLSAILQADLADAGIPFRDESGRVFDFHSLRHEFGTLLANSGAGLKEAQELMRHADVNLTWSLYSHTLEGKSSKAVAALPDLSTEAAAKTGTDGREDFLRNSYVPGGSGRTSTDLDGRLAALKPRPIANDADSGKMLVLRAPF